ncbi:MAG: TlpA disulfide reductase family protein [Kiloniellaceae bacterium]
MFQRTARSFPLAIACAALVVLGSMVAGAPAARATPPALQGEFAEDFNLLDPPVKAPPVALRDLDGKRVRLGDFRGQVVLLNFWATWCAPCVREMPALDRLQAALGGDGLAVVAASIDRGGRPVVEAFAKRLKLTRLGLYLDPKSAMARALGLSGLPTTYLIDRAGGVVGVMTGAAEWDSPAAKALIRHYLGEPAPGADGATVKTSG